MSSRRRLAPELEAAAAQGGFACPQGFSGAVIGYLMAWTHGWRNTWVLSLLNVKPDDRVLEIGFGPGTEMRRVAQLAKRGFVAGIDLSEVMLRQASRRNRGYIREGRVELRLASMSAIPYPDGSFDKVFGINCIQFSPDLLHDLGEIRRVLKPGGLAALAVQPLWKGATDATAVDIGRNLCAAMVEVGFDGCRVEQRRVWPRMTVCAIGQR
jgi:ubiquinone/menaquinone biosynthesis C-methylase UbiE